MWTLSIHSQAQQSTCTQSIWVFYPAWCSVLLHLHLQEVLSLQWLHVFKVKKKKKPYHLTSQKDLMWHLLIIKSSPIEQNSFKKQPCFLIQSSLISHICHMVPALWVCTAGVFIVSLSCRTPPQSPHWMLQRAICWTTLNKFLDT